MSQASAIFYYHADHLGSNEVISDEIGSPHEFHLTLPFGETMVEQRKPMADYYNSWKFTSKELDEETGLYYFGARYYNPSLSIWLSVDPLAEQMPEWSSYAYTFNNPVNYVDPDGKKPQDWIKNIKTGEIMWFDGTGEKAIVKASLYWGGGLFGATNYENYQTLGVSFLVKVWELQ